MFDESKLAGKIVEICGTRQEFGKKMNMAPGTLAARLKGNGWRRDEMIKCAEVLKLTEADFNAIFFADCVQ